jgi:hypothetical protein
MTIIGSYFTSMRAERRGAPRGKINVNNNISIRNIEESEMQVDKSN